MRKPPIGAALCCALFTTWPVPLSAGPGPRALEFPAPPPPLPPAAEGEPPPPQATIPLREQGLAGTQVLEGKIVKIHGLRQRAA